MGILENLYKDLLPHSSTKDIDLITKKCNAFVSYLKKKDDILFLTTSNRYSKHTWDIPKSTQFARLVKKHFPKKNIRIIDVAPLKIYTCEGNISQSIGNKCGVNEALLKNKRMNPSGYHRCWASINNKDDELYKITRILFKSKVVVFFGSVRWGQVNSIYQQLYERLSWIENRVTTLQEKPIKEIIKCEAGIVLFGHNWNGDNVLNTQKQNYNWFGFKAPDELSFNWQYSDDPEEESAESYTDAIQEFQQLIHMTLPKESSKRK